MSTFEVTADGEVSDGHHTFKELYRYRLLYNAALFNEWAKVGLYDTHKSKLHHDGMVPFGDPKWFIVMAELPTGQISNHYRVDDWELFKIDEWNVSKVYDGHTPAMVAERLEKFLRQDVGERCLYRDLKDFREHLLYVHKNEAAMNLTRSEAEDQHWHEHNGPGGLRLHSHTSSLKVSGEL